MAIYIYAPSTKEFSNNGLGALTPIECTIKEEAAGMYELTLVHPIDETKRWAQIENDCIIKAPVPVRESPMYELSVPIKENTITRQVWVVARTSHGAYLRSGPGMNYSRIGRLYNGDEVIEISTVYNGDEKIVVEDCKDPWIKVCVVDGGAVAYMSTKWLDKSSRTETINNGGVIESRVVRVQQSRDQLFRIYSVETDTEAHTVTAKAMHIFYDLRGNIVADDYTPEDEAANSVVANLVSKLSTKPDMEEYPFTFEASTLTASISGEYGWKNIVECLLEPEEGIVAKTKALFVRDNFDVFLVPDAVRDRDVTIRRGKNLIGVTVTNDAADIVTRIVPEGKNKDGDPLLLSDKDEEGLWLNSIYVESPRIGNYKNVYTQRIEYDVKVVDGDADNEKTFKNEDAAREKLRALANADFNENGVDLPTYGMEVDFVLLQNTADYANYASLQAVHLYDTVTVIDELIGLKAKVRVTGYTWDVLAQQYESVTLGELQDVKQTVYGYNIANGSVSGNKIINNSANGSILRDFSVQYAKIAVAAVRELNAQSINAMTARIQEIVAGSITTDELYAALADISKATIQSADIDWASIERLSAVIAELSQAEIGAADIDWAHIKDLATDTAIITEGVGGQLMISRLAVTEANMVSLTTGELVVKGEDGRFYSVSVDEDGNVQAQLKQVGNDDVSDLSINAGEKIIEGTVPAACLNATDIFAENALIAELIAKNINVDQLFARETFTTLLKTTKIVGDKSITMIAGEAEDALEAANKSISNVQTQYASGASTVNPPTDGWSVFMPAHEKGVYIWQRTVTLSNSGESTTSEPVCISGADGEDAVVLRIDSSRGTVFKNNMISTVLSAVIYRGGDRITDGAGLHNAFGSGAYLQWSWQRMDEDRFGVISSSDSRLSEDGFSFTLSPEDVDSKVTFMCELII